MKKIFMIRKSLFFVSLSIWASALALPGASALAQGLRAGSGGGLSSPSSSSGALGLGGLVAPGLGANLDLPRNLGADAGGSRGAEQADYIVAVVNSEPITNNEVRLRAARVTQQLLQSGIAVPPKSVLDRQVLERLINEKAQLQQARESGIKIDDLAVDTAEQNVAKQNNLSLPDMLERLAADGVTEKRLREDLRNQLTLLRQRQREVESRVKVSDLDVDRFIQEQRQAAVNPDALEINLAHILVLVPENATPAEVATLQKKAQTAADRARAGEDFGTVAREFSDGSERTNNGLLGLRPASRYPSLFVEWTQNQPIGTIVGPNRSPAGFHVLKVVERIKGGVSGAEVLQSHVRHILLAPGPQLTEAAAIAQLADYRRRIQSGQTDFATLAKENSMDGTAKDGGDLGWTNPGQFVPEFEQAADVLAPGEISNPVVTRYGVHLIQVLERRPHTLTQREQRDIARTAAREKKLDEAYATWAQEVRGRAYVEYRDPPR